MEEVIDRFIRHPQGAMIDRAIHQHRETMTMEGGMIIVGTMNVPPIHLLHALNNRSLQTDLPIIQEAVTTDRIIIREASQHLTILPPGTIHQDQVTPPEMVVQVILQEVTVEDILHQVAVVQGTLPEAVVQAHPQGARANPKTCIRKQVSDCRKLTFLQSGTHYTRS